MIEYEVLASGTAALLAETTWRVRAFPRAPPDTIYAAGCLALVGLSAPPLKSPTNVPAPQFRCHALPAPLLGPSATPAADSPNFIGWLVASCAHLALPLNNGAGAVGQRGGAGGAPLAHGRPAHLLPPTILDHLEREHELVYRSCSRLCGNTAQSGCEEGQGHCCFGGAPTPAPAAAPVVAVSPPRRISAPRPRACAAEPAPDASPCPGLARHREAPPWLTRMPRSSFAPFLLTVSCLLGPYPA